MSLGSTPTKIMATRRLYYDDSFQREFTARVLSCEPRTVSPSPEAKASTWQAILDQTAFYPTSGGQPHDVGKIGDARVLEVGDRKDEIVHIVDRRLACVEVKSSLDGTAEELLRQGVRKEVDREGVLRAIEIAGVELQPCGGTHVKSTGQIGLILVRRSTKIRQDWRVEFVCGGRAENLARRDFALLRESAERLSCAQEEVVSALGRALAERDANFKNYRELLERLAAAEAALVLQSTASDSDGVRVIDRALTGIQAEFLGLFATAIAKREKTIALLGRLECGQILFAQHPSSGKDMNALLRQVFEKFDGKGGGTRDFARGKVADPAHLEAALALARGKLFGA